MSGPANSVAQSTTLTPVSGGADGSDTAAHRCGEAAQALDEVGYPAADVVPGRPSQLLAVGVNRHLPAVRELELVLRREAVGDLDVRSGDELADDLRHLARGDQRGSGGAVEDAIRVVG